MLTIDKKDAMQAYPVIFALAYLFKNYKETAAQVAIDETINFSEKLAPFINPEYGVQKEVFVCLAEILSLDNYNCHILQKFILRYGELPVKENRTLKLEMYQECPEILELAMQPQILTWSKLGYILCDKPHKPHI